MAKIPVRQVQKEQSIRERVIEAAKNRKPKPELKELDEPKLRVGQAAGSFLAEQLSANPSIEDMDRLDRIAAGKAAFGGAVGGGKTQMNEALRNETLRRLEENQTTASEQCCESSNHPPIYGSRRDELVQLRERIMRQHTHELNEINSTIQRLDSSNAEQVILEADKMMNRIGRRLQF